MIKEIIKLHYKTIEKLKKQEKELDVAITKQENYIKTQLAKLNNKYAIEYIDEYGIFNNEIENFIDNIPEFNEVVNKLIFDSIIFMNHDYKKFKEIIFKLDDAGEL